MKLTRAFLAASLFALAACATTKGANEITRIGPVVALPAPNAPDGAIYAIPMPSAPLDMSKTVTRIIFASCAQQREDQSIWDVIAGENPDLVLYMGDNVYGDVRSNDPALPELKAAYMRLAESKPFERVRTTTPVIAGWDDHDYGVNDAGGDYPYKEQSEALFDYVWGVGPDDPRAAHPGTHGSWIIGVEDGKRVQVILLDTRYFRSPLKPTDQYGAPGKERYLPDADPAKTMLGEAQWAWLAEELKKPADLRLLVSSIQVIADGHGFEAWREFPLEREKLYATIKASGADGVVILSGDRHLAGLYRRAGVNDYALFEATSSSLNLPASAWRAQSGETYVEPGPYRLGDPYYDANYGLLEVDWAAGAVAVTIRSKDGAPVLSEIVRLADLR